MGATRRSAWLASMAVALMAWGCLGIVRWESKREASWRAAARAMGLGGWTTLRFDPTSGQSDVSGELIAVGKDSLLLLNAGDLVALPTSALGSAIVEIREDTLYGAPHQLRPLKLVHPSPKNWRKLAPFARFPQGLSANADSSVRSSIRSPSGTEAR